MVRVRDEDWEPYDFSEWTFDYPDETAIAPLIRAVQEQAAQVVVDDCIEYAECPIIRMDDEEPLIFYRMFDEKFPGWGLDEVFVDTRDVSRKSLDIFKAWSERVIQEAEARLEELSRHEGGEAEPCPS